MAILAFTSRREMLSSSLTTLFVLIMGVAIVGGLAGLLYAVLARKEALLYQGEDHCPSYSPHCALNSGQMLLRNRSMVEAVLAAMPARFDATTPLDQAIAAAALRADGYAATSLPPHFSGHCWFGRSGLSLCELTTYHAHCCVNDREKLAVIGRVLRDSAGCDFAHSAPGARSRCTLGECG